jgi:hypothetical protein
VNTVTSTNMKVLALEAAIIIALYILGRAFA